MKIKIPTLIALGLIGAGSLSGQVLNEFQPNPVGGDPANVDFELMGSPLGAFDLWILSIESDVTTGTGFVDRAANVTGAFDASGMAVVSIPDLENPSFTILLTDAFTGAVGTTDIDTDNDGIVDDVSAFGTLLDALGVPDAVGEPVYGSQLGGVDFSYTGDEPQSVFRDSVTSLWYAVNDPAGTDVFDLSGTAIAGTSFDIDPTVTPSTFGSANPAVVPEPSTYAALIGLLALGLVMIRRRKA